MRIPAAAPEDAPLTAVVARPAPKPVGRTDVDPVGMAHLQAVAERDYERVVATMFPALDSKGVEDARTALDREMPILKSLSLPPAEAARVRDVAALIFDGLTRAQAWFPA